ncbi:MAG: hypothetical protein IJ045_03870 [Ruminiclostridium sp.]|nr:hypothetical protein [Ruminiclostridium sp.]
MNLPYTILKIKDREYRLKITAANAIELEKKLGKSLVDGMADFDKVGTLTAYLSASLKAYENIAGEVTELYDDYINEGGSMSQLSDVLVEVLIVSGFLQRPQIDALRAQMKIMGERLTKMQEK